MLFISGFCSLATAGHAEYRIPAARVDQRVELMSIVFRLAGSKEYNTTENVKYVTEIHLHFDKFINHPLILFAKKLVGSNNIGYDAVMSMAVNLNMPPSLEPIAPFSKQIIDSRWSVGDAERFVHLLKQFYKDSSFDIFFRTHAAEYTIAERRFEVLSKKVDLRWYYDFFGENNVNSFQIMIGFGNGRGNYGLHKNCDSKRMDVYAIIGCAFFDHSGRPVYDSSAYLATLLHEFNHSYINDLLIRYKKRFDTAGQILFREQAIKMHQQAYMDEQTMMNEALVRAVVIRYFSSHAATSGEIADNELKLQFANGFVWMDSLVKLLEVYENERSEYPTLESFIPKIAEYYKHLTLKIERSNTDAQ